MQTFGNYLKKQRDEKKITLKEVALLTNITERYLDFIEKDDYEKVPEGPFIRGYISSYATAIGIDAHETLDRFDSLCKERNIAEDIQPEISKGKIRQAPIAFLINRRRWFFPFFAILILLTFGVYHSFSQDQEKAHAVANLQGTKDKGLQATLPIPMKPEDNMSQFSLKNGLMFTKQTRK